MSGIDWGWITLNLAYVIYITSPVFKKMLQLRSVLLAATIVFIIYGIVANVWSVVWWNIPFGLMHVWQIMLLVRERMGVKLTDEDEAVRVLLTPGLEPSRFNVLWQAGTEHELTDQTLTRKGEPVDSVWLVLEGQVEVTDGTGLRLPLGPLSFVGEQSALSGDPATASAACRGTVRLRKWDQDKLRELGRAHPDIRQAGVLAIAHDLSNKVPSPARPSRDQSFGTA